MLLKRFIGAAVMLAIYAAHTMANGVTKEELARAAVSDDAEASRTAIAELRGMGQKGLDAIIAVHSLDIERFSATGDRSGKWQRLASAIDSVAMQKDAYASGLYWYTDLEEAKNVADDRNRPILSLRLLGNLNEEYSCANSRLFRSILYANKELAAYLRENYVLHWRSVRPAPRITIDFGDGRKIERTITGNSIHYVLDEHGMIIDALPGLYGPSAFLIYLKQAAAVNRSIDGHPAADRHRALLRYRKLSFDKIKERRDNALKLAEISLKETGGGTDALSAAPIAATKMAVVDEISLLRVYDNFARFEPQIDLSDWQRVSAIYIKENGLDAASKAFIRRQNRNSGRTEGEFAGLFEKLGRFISLDTTRNDFLYRTQIYSLLNRSEVRDLEQFNDRVYGEIFKTPSSDRWLGLYSTDVYTALDGNGVVQ